MTQLSKGRIQNLGEQQETVPWGVLAQGFCPKQARTRQKNSRNGARSAISPRLNVLRRANRRVRITWRQRFGRPCNQTKTFRRTLRDGGVEQIVEAFVDPSQPEVKQVIESILAPAHADSLETLLDEPLARALHQPAADGQPQFLEASAVDVIAVGVRRMLFIRVVVKFVSVLRVESDKSGRSTNQE